MSNGRETPTDKSLEMLFEYTKFHIGLYLTLTAAYITAASASINNLPILSINVLFLIPAILLFFCAGISGGVIASSLTQTECRTTKEFLNQDIGPWEWSRLHFQARKWTWIEHTSFWLGLICAALSFVKI